MDVSENSGTPKPSIWIGFSISFTIHFGVPLFLETPTWRCCFKTKPDSCGKMGSVIQLIRYQISPSPQDLLEDLVERVVVSHLWAWGPHAHNRRSFHGWRDMEKGENQVSVDRFLSEPFKKCHGPMLKEEFPAGKLMENTQIMKVCRDGCSEKVPFFT